MNYTNIKNNRAAIFFALFFLLTQITFSQLSNLDKRCLWIVRDSMYDEKSISEALVYSYEAGYDVVFVQVRGRGYSFYNSDIVPKNPKIHPGFDPLQYAINLGNALGIEVHAWVNSYILWSSKKAPENINHIYHTNKEWTETNMHGKSDAQVKLSKLQSPQWEGVYLAPTHPEVNPYLLSIFEEIINNYDIDGLHLDYIRYQNDIYGYNKFGMVDFDKRYNINPRDIVRGIISTRFGWAQSYVDSIYFAWDQYRRDAVTDLVEKTYESINLSGKNIILSAAVKPNLLESKKRFFQEWDKWVINGNIDYVVPMNYFKDISDFNKPIQIMKSNLTRDELNMVILGISTYNQDAQSAADKILLSRLNGFKGISIFSWNSHKNNIDWFIPINEALGNIGNKYD